MYEIIYKWDQALCYQLTNLLASCYFKGVYIVGAKRTVFGTFGGKLKDHNATVLASAATVAALKAAKVTPEQVDSVICGNVSSVSIDSILKKQRHNS